jgi:epsilon-lactone hydrolase
MSVGKISSTQQIPENGRTPRELLADDAAPSWQSRCIVGLMRLLPIKKRLASAAAVQEHVRRMALRPASHTPTGLGRGVEVTLKNVAGWPVYYTAPSANPDAGNYVMFLHGGGFINEIARAHLGLAAAQWLRDSGYRQPNGLVLISPGVDASVNSAEHIAIAPSDPLQDIPGILEAARLYAGDLYFSHPYVSPLQGDFRGLAPMIIFSGTLDLIYPDSIELALKARAAGVPVELHLRQGQPHNYAAMPTPEGREARAAIVRALAVDLT